MMNLTQRKVSQRFIERKGVVTKVECKVGSQGITQLGGLVTVL